MRPGDVADMGGVWRPTAEEAGGIVATTSVDSIHDGDVLDLDLAGVLAVGRELGLHLVQRLGQLLDAVSQSLLVLEVGRVIPAPIKTTSKTIANCAIPG